jgi:hypothetical protein
VWQWRAPVVVVEPVEPVERFGWTWVDILYHLI